MNRASGELVNHGIREEISDIRAHVCVRAQVLYVFETKQLRELVASGRYRKTFAETDGVVTSEGFVIPVASIPGIRTFAIPESILQQVAFTEADDTSKKGQKAQSIVEAFIQKGWFPFTADTIMIEDIQSQRDGVDLMVRLSARIQVKCDWNGGGPGQRGCTGNVYIEVAEANPHRRY